MIADNRHFDRGVIVCCALRDNVVQRAFAGDAQAQAILRAMLPADVPPSLRREERDRRIREIAMRLRAVLPGARPHTGARLLASAGDRLQRGRNLGSARPFDLLTTTERAA